ncbi:MAG: DUF1847 domain-containing protein [Prolixibacteraceae bacterium]
MDCTGCKNKVCRKGEQCAVVNFDVEEVIASYHKEQKIVQAAAQLVDFGRAGTLSRLQETIEFSKLMDFQTIGLAYCYGMESDAKLITNHLRSHGFKVEAASCTVGGIAQNDVNLASNICNVSCNPIGQARQLNMRKPDLVITMGLCLGHDILFNREIKSDTTTLLVKDRVYNNQPGLELIEIANKNN